MLAGLDKSTTPRLIVFTGGGTAGHVQPALAVAQALERAGYDRSFLSFVGSTRGMEARLVPEAGFSLTLLPGRGIVRRFSLQNLRSVAELGLAFVRALALLMRRRPSVVVSVGGYAALPCSLAAVVLRIPLVVINVDTVPGATNRLISRLAVVSATTSGDTDLPRAVLTGAPLRAGVRLVERSPAGRARARQVLAIPEHLRVVAITGGSLGAWRLNQAALGLARVFSDEDVLIYHVTGERDFARVGQMVEHLHLHSTATSHYRVVAYEERLPELYAAADLVIARAGAMTIAELAAIGTPAILVPLPHAPRDHQAKNAEVLSNAGAAIFLADSEAQPEVLAELVQQLLDNPDRLEEMGKRALALGRLDAAEQVASLIERVLTRRAVLAAVMAR